MFNLVIALFAGFNVERFGRRPLFLTSIIGMMLSYCFVTGLSAGFAQTGARGLGIAVLPFLFR
jgi:MFS family permease